MNKSSLRQQQIQLQQQQQQQQMMADNDAAALAAEMFDAFCAATTMRQILGLYRNMCDTIGLRSGPINEFYPKLKQKIRSWKAQALWKKFDTRASHRVYNKGNACTGSRVLVIGAGPCGLRAAIEAQLLGAKVCVVEKRDRISRNNVVHLWPFVITDLRNLGAKKFYGKFCAGSIDHISIRQLQCILLKVALLLGVEIHEGVSFLNTIEPSDGCGWRAEVEPTDHAVSHYEFDVLFGADGKRNTLEGFKRKEFRGKLAIAITANFINKKTEAEARAEEISGVAFIFNQSFFKELYQTTGIDLENIVYYKDETHYFVMTAKKHSLIDKNVIIQDFADPAELLAPKNVNTDKLSDYAREAAEFSTKYQMPNLEFAVNHYGKPDVAMFDFTSMFAAEASSRVIVRKNYRLLQCLVGDSLLEPFWPTGSGCARGFLSSMDAAYMIKLYANQRNSILGTLAQRESIYRLLAQTTPENLQRDIGAYTVDPATRYPNLNKSIVNVWQVKHLIDTDDPNLLEQVHMDTNALQQANIEMPIRRKRRTGDTMPLSTVLLRWIKAQLHAHEFAQNITEASECLTNGKTLCALINRYRPDLIDLNIIKDLKPIECNELAFKILETDLNVPRCISSKQSMSLENVESKIWLNYLEQICEEFRGEIPHVKHPKLDYFQSKEKSSRDKKPDFSHLLNRTTKSKAKSPMQDIDLTTGVHRRSILDEDKVKRQRKIAGNGNESVVLVAGHGGDTSRRAKKRRSQEKTANIEERQQRLKEIEANRLERQSKRKQQRYQQTQNFYKSLQMLQAQNLLHENADDQPFEDYSIYMYRQNAPEFNDRVKMLEQKLLHPDRERGIQSAFSRSTDEQFSNRIKSMEQQITSRTTSGTDKKPKDLLRAIGKIDSNDWNIREIEKKIEQSKKTETPGKSKEKVPKWSKEQFLARQNKMSKPPVEREEESEEKFKEIDQTLKNLDKQLKEGSIREVGERGKNKVASIAGQFGKKDDTSDEKPAPSHTKHSSKVPSVFKNQAASEKCHFCKQTVYLMEKIATENLILHRSCLKCYHCHTNLRLGAYAFDRDDPVGRFYCTQHFRLPAKAIRPMARKSTKQQKRPVATALQPSSADGDDSKNPDQILRGRPETVVQLDLLDRGQTPERIEFENADAMSDGEPSLENIIDENEWTDRNFITDSDDSESDLSSSDESDDESESFEDADEGSPIAQTLQLATDWIGKQRYSNGGSDDSDNDFYDSSDGLLDENDADSQTEGEEFKKAREMRRQEVKLLPIPTNLATDTETEVKPNDDVQLNDNNNNSNQNNNSDNNNKNSNENLTINNSISICSSDNNINNIPSKTEIKIIERDLGRAISTEIDTLNENLFNLNNFLKLNKEVENIRKENLVKNDIMKKLSLKEKWLNETHTGASNLSLNKIGEQSETGDITGEKLANKEEVGKVELEKEVIESEKLNLGEIEINDHKTEITNSQDDVKMDVDTNEKHGTTESNTENNAAEELKTLENEKSTTESGKENNDKTISSGEVNNKVNEIVATIKSITIEKSSKEEQPVNPKDLSKSIENLNNESLKTNQKTDDADIGQLLYDVENKCSPKVQRRKKSNALKKIEARSFADTKGVIESQITGPKMSKQSSLDLSRYFPNQKQEKTSTVAANKNQKTLKDVDLNQYFAQSPVAQRKISTPTKLPSALRKSSTDIIPALYKPTIKEKLAAVEPASDEKKSGSSTETTKPIAKVNQLLYKPTMKEILASSATEVKSTTSSPIVYSKPKPNILHYKPTMKEILAGPVDISKLETESRPIPPKRQKYKDKEIVSTENLNKKKSKDSDFNIYDQQVDGSVDLKKKVSTSISKTDEKNTPKKKIIKKVAKKSPSSSITGDSPKLKKKINNESSKSEKPPLNYEDEILNEILNSDDNEVRSPSIEYQKLFQEEKSPSEDISDRIENILIETGIDLGLPRRSSNVNRKKLIKAKSLGEDEFTNNKNELSVFEGNDQEECDRRNGFQSILKRFESMSSVKQTDDKTVDNKLNDINERRYSKDSIKSKKSSSDEFSDLERTLEYLKSEWKTEATNFLQKKRSNFFSKPKSTNELCKQIEDDGERLKRNTEQFFEGKKYEEQIKYEKLKITKEKSPKRKIMDNGNNKTKEIKIDRTKEEKELIKPKNSDENKIVPNHKELQKRKNSNDKKIAFKTIGKVKSFEICDSELDDMEVDDIFNEIVNELHINDDKLGTPDIDDVLANQEVFESNKQHEIINKSKNVQNTLQNISPVKATKSESNENKLANKSSVEKKDLNGIQEDSKNDTYKKEVHNTQIQLEKLQDNILPKKLISPKESIQNYTNIKPNKEISSKLQQDSKISVSYKEVDSPKKIIEVVKNNFLPVKSHSPEDIKLKLTENIKSKEINKLQQDIKPEYSSNKEILNSVTNLETVNENCVPRKFSLPKSNSPKSDNLEYLNNSKLYTSTTEINNSKSELEMIRKNSLQKTISEISNSPKLNTPKTEIEQENKLYSPAHTKSPISGQKMSSINRSKSSTDEDSIDQLFSQFTDDMLVDVEFDSNDELIAITPRAIVKKSDEIAIENLECIATTSEPTIRKSADKNDESNAKDLEIVSAVPEPIIRKSSEKDDELTVENLKCVSPTFERTIHKATDNNDESTESVPHMPEKILHKSSDKNDELNIDNLKCVSSTFEPNIHKSEDKNDESNKTVAHIPETIVRKSSEKNYELNVGNLESVSTISNIRKSADKNNESNVQNLENVSTMSEPIIRTSAEKNNELNFEHVSIKSEPIIRKSEEKSYKQNFENLKSLATEITSKKSVEEDDIQFPMKPPRRQKTVSSSASPDIPNIPIRAKHIAKQAKELPPSVQDILESMHTDVIDDNNLCIIPINNAKPLRFPSRYEEEEDINMELVDEIVDCDNIILADELTTPKLEPATENGRPEISEDKIVDSIDNFLTSKDKLHISTVSDNEFITGDNSTVLDKSTASETDSQQIEMKLSENTFSAQNDNDLNFKDTTVDTPKSYLSSKDICPGSPNGAQDYNKIVSCDNILITNNTVEVPAQDKMQITLTNNDTQYTNVTDHSNTHVDGTNASIRMNENKLNETVAAANLQAAKENVQIHETEKISILPKNIPSKANTIKPVPEIPESELEDWEIIEKLERERMRALRKRDQMYFNANNSSSLVDRPRLQTQISSSDSFESASSKSIPELSIIQKNKTPSPIPPHRSPRPGSKVTHGDSTGQKSLPIEVIEHPLPSVDRAYSPSSTQSKNSSHSLSHSVESVSTRSQRPKSNPSENVDYGTRMLLERSQMLRDRKKDFMEDKMVGNNPYMKKMISTERKHRVDSDNDDDVEFPESYRPSSLSTRNTNYSRFPTSRAIQDRLHYNSAASSGIDRYGTGTSTSSQYNRRLSPINTTTYTSPINSSRHLTDYFKRSPSSSKDHHYHHHHPRDQSKDSCIISVQSDSESSSADDDVNSATEISTDSEFDQDPITRETPKILIDDTHLRKPTKVQIKQVIIGNNNVSNHPPKLKNVTNTKLTSNALQNALTHQQLEFKPLVQVDPSLLNSNRIMPLKNPRPGDYLLNKTASTEGIASKTSLELKKRYLLGGEQTGFGNKIMKSGSTSILDTKLKSFHSNISECQRKLNPASDISAGMKTFLDRTSKLATNDKISVDIEKKLSETEMKLKKDLEEKENVFVNSKNELNKGMEYSETVNSALIEHIAKNPKTIQPIKIPSPIIETIDLISPEKEVPKVILKQTEFNKKEKSDDSIEIIDLTYSPPAKIEKPDISQNSIQHIPDIIQQTEKNKAEPPPPPLIAFKTEELDNECQDTCIQVPQIPWPTKKNSKDDVESDSLSSSSSTSSLEDIPHYILDSTTSPDTQNCGTGGGGIVPRLEVHDTSGALMQIDSLMIIDGKYIGDPEDLPLMEIPEGMTTSTPTITEATTIVDNLQSINNEVLSEKAEESKEIEIADNKNLSKISVVNSTKDLKFDSKNENKIESLKNLPSIYDKKNEEKKPKPQSLDLVKTVVQTSSTGIKFSPITVTPTSLNTDNDKTPTANDNNHQTDSETEQTGLLTETELSDWTADDAVSENFVDIEFVLNSNKGTIKRNKKGKKGKLNSKCSNISQIKNSLRQEKYSPAGETPRECGGILENLAIGEIDFMDTGSEGSCAETYAATNNALIKNRGYIEFIENTGHNEYSPTTTPNNFNVINLRQNTKPNFPDDLTSYKRSNSNKEILGIDYIEQGACILNSNINNEIELKTPVNEISLPIFSIGKPISESATTSQQSPKLQQHQQLQSLTDSTNELDDDSLVMMTSQSGTNTNTTTTEESDALTVVTSPLDSTSPKIQENLMTTTNSSSATTSSTGTNNKFKENKSLSSNSNHKIPSPLPRRKYSNEAQQISSSNRKRSSQEDLLNNPKSKDSDEMSYEEYVRKLQQKITQISNAKDSIDVRKHKRKTSRGSGDSGVPTINEFERKEKNEMETKDLSQNNKSLGDMKSLSIFSNNLITNEPIIQKQEVHKVPEIPTLSSKLEEITKQRTKQKDLIHDLVMDKLQSKKQLNAEKRLNRSRNRNSVFSPRGGSNDNNLMISSTPKLVMSSSNDCTNNYNLTKSATEQMHNINENKKKNASPKENKNVVQMFNQANIVNRKQRPLSDNLDKFAHNSHNYEQSQIKQINDSKQYTTPMKSINHNFDETPLSAYTGKMKAEARIRARLKSNQDLGLSPEEKLQLLRKRYHLDLQDIVNNKNTAEELKARQRKMITSKSVNDISAVQHQQSSHLLTSDENFNTTKSNANNIIDFTSDPNLSNSINCTDKPVKLSRRHKDPERRKSLIQTFSNFFNKNKKDNTAILNETSTTKEKESKQTVEVAGSVFSRFRISPKSKDKAKEKEETPPFEQCNLTQDCLKHEFSSTPHLFNNNKIIDDTALAAAASGALIAVTATPGIITNSENTIDNYDNDDDDDDEEPPPIPPLPLNYQRSDDENYTTDTREYQKKQRAISKASRQAELKRIRIAQEIQREQEEIEVQLKEYEARGVIIEKALRGEGQNIENLETSSMGASDEKLLKELLEIWRNITQLKKRDEELGIRQQELKLEHRHAQLKDELNMRLSSSKLDKSSADVAAEGAILNEMLEIVAKRAALRPNEQSTINSQAGSYVSSINQQSTSNESDQI